MGVLMAKTKKEFTNTDVDDEDEDQAEEKKRRKEWSKCDFLKDYVNALKQQYRTDLSHIEPENLLYVGFSKKKSSCVANIRPVKDMWSLFHKEVYILAIHIESWEALSEQERMYVVFHELLHLPEFGFDKNDKEYKKLLKHDVQDFSVLLNRFGVFKENLDKIKKNGDVITNDESDYDEESDMEDDE